MLLRVGHLLAHYLVLPSSMCLALSDHQTRKNPSFIRQSFVPFADRSNSLPLVAYVMWSRYGVVIELTLLAGMAYLHSRRARLVVWIPFYYCENLLRIPGFADLMIAMTPTGEIDKVDQSNYHGDPSAALLEVLDLKQNVAFNVYFFAPSPRPFFLNMDSP